MNLIAWGITLSRPSWAYQLSPCCACPKLGTGRPLRLPECFCSQVAFGISNRPLEVTKDSFLYPLPGCKKRRNTERVGQRQVLRASQLTNSAVWVTLLIWLAPCEATGKWQKLMVGGIYKRSDQVTRPGVEITWYLVISLIQQIAACKGWHVTVKNT